MKGDFWWHARMVPNRPHDTQLLPEAGLFDRPWRLPNQAWRLFDQAWRQSSRSLVTWKRSSELFLCFNVDLAYSQGISNSWQGILRDLVAMLLRSPFQQFYQKSGPGLLLSYTLQNNFLKKFLHTGRIIGRCFYVHFGVDLVR